MKLLSEDAHDALFCPATHQFGVLLWHLLKAAQLQQARGGRFRDTEFGKEVGRDEIHWWIFKKEDDLDRLRAQSESALNAADSLKWEATKLMETRLPQSYASLLSTLRGFADTHQASTQLILDYVSWLRGRDPLAPSILFTYRVWGTTRRSNRWIEVNKDNPQEETDDIKRWLTETALGLRNVYLYRFDSELMEFYDSGGDDPENAGEIEISEVEVVLRTSFRVFDEFSSFLEQLRDSLRNILLDIARCVKQRNVMHDDAFWRRFITAAAHSETLEPQLWDFKETLAIWSPRPRDPTKDHKVTFAEDVASFANTDGGVLIVGVSDTREIVGLESVDDLESRLQFAKITLCEKIVYPRELVVFRQVMVPDGVETRKFCLVIIVAKAAEVVGVDNGNGKFTYPVRHETGISRISPDAITHKKMHEKSDSYDFLVDLEQFLRDNPA